MDSSTKVIVLGQTVADKLFGAGIDPVGRQVRVRNVPFQVVGVLSAKGQSPVGQDLDDAAFVPYTTFRAKVQGGLKNLIQGTIFVGAVSEDATSRAESQIRALLRDRHHLAEGADDDFGVRNLAEAASASEEGRPDPHHPARRHRRGVAGGGRHRDHEHHAGVGHGADPRDRRAHGRRGARPGHPAPVPDRGAGTLHRRAAWWA